ncbi:M48 family metalloprotease [Priestia megaterium]|nr:M48 family metalloprotease [Priestia megaterium]
MNQEAQLIYKGEKSYFTIVLIVSILAYVALAFSLIGLAITVIFTLVSLIAHALMIGNIRINAVKLSEQQFPETHFQVQQLSSEMKLKKVPDVYVMESNGVLNAFATRFFGRNMVVLYSEIFELVEEEAVDELAFVIAHELAHIKRNHILKSFLILLAMWIPGLGEMYLRACEYTCDRYAAYYVSNAEAAKRSLTVLAVGKKLYTQVNREAYLLQAKQERSVFVVMNELLSTHPPLPKRIAAIGEFMNEPENVKISIGLPKMLVILVPVSMIMFVGALLVSGFNFYQSEAVFWNDMLLEDEMYYDEEDDEYSLSPLTEAVVNGDTSKLRALIAKGEDLTVQDDHGYTPLHWAAKAGEVEVASLLLSEGVAVDELDSVEKTPLMSAAENGESEIVELLIQNGAKVNATDADDISVLTYAIDSMDADTVRALLKTDVDVHKMDSSGMTPLMEAIEYSNQEIVDLIKKAMKKEEMKESGA